MTDALLDLLADGTHANSRVRFLPALGALAEPLAGVWSSSERAAGWVHRQHGTGAVVATTLHASHDSLACLIGTWRAGGRLVSFPARARGQDLQGYRSQLIEACEATAAQVLVVADPADEAYAELPLPVEALASLASGPPLTELLPGGDLVQFSSGTTAAPKGIILSLDAVGANVAAILDRLDLPGPGVSCSWLPLSHDMGLIGMCLVPWAAFGPRWQDAGEMVLIPTDAFVRNPSIWLRACAEHRATVTTAPTFGYELAARRLSPTRPLDLGSLRACIVGAEPVTKDVLEGFAAAAEPFGLDPDSLCPAYGLAEAALAVALHAPGTAWHAEVVGETEGRQRPLVSCGTALDCVQVDVVDEDDGIGRLVVRGPSLFDGYVGQAPIVPEEGHDTGDLGAVRDGEVFVSGRVQDLLFIGGTKLGAAEVELAAQRASGLRPDGAAAVQVSSTGYAVVVERRKGGSARAGASDLGHLVRREVVATFGRGPAEVVVVAPGTLPRTPSGKIQRHRVRDLLADDALEVDARVVFQANRQAAKTDP